MNPRLVVAPNPCATCPYARSTPPGVWDASEYAKLVRYDADPCIRPPFMCHETQGLPERGVCKGWLVVHRESVAVRLAVFRGQLGPEDVPLAGSPALYSSGTEAATAGMRGVARPSRTAREAILKINARRSRKKNR
jgi:hypothetical protein